MKGFARAACAALAVALAAEALAAQPVVRLAGRDNALSGRFSTVFEVGREEGRSWEVFSDVRQVAFDAQDNLYVLDRGNARVLVFDRNGRFVRQIGKKGGGPGELTSPSSLAVTVSGEVVVSDNGRRAFSVFSRDGRFLRSVAHDGRYGISGLGLAAHPRGGVVTVAQPLPIGGGTPANSVLWYPLTANAQTAKLLEVADEPAEAAEVPAGRATARVISNRKPAFAPTMRWELLPTGGVVAASKAEYSVLVTNPRGTVTRVLERPLRPRAVTERDREAELARRREATAGGANVTVMGGGSLESLPPEVRAVVQQAISGAEFARVVPVIQDLSVDRAGRIWVQRAGSVAGTPGPVDILSPDGRYLGTLPAQPIPNAFSASGRAAFIVKDDLGVEKVIVRTVPNVGS